MPVPQTDWLYWWFAGLNLAEAPSAKFKDGNDSNAATMLSGVKSPLFALRRLGDLSRMNEHEKSVTKSAVSTANRETMP